MSRQDALEEIFYELKAATVEASACVQNDAPTDILFTMLHESRKTIENAFNQASRKLALLDEHGVFDK